MKYISYKKMGAYLMMLREKKFGKRSRSEFIRLLNEVGEYRWDQSAYRKCELGQMILSLDRLAEVCIVLDVNPGDVIDHSLLY